MYVVTVKCIVVQSWKAKTLHIYVRLDTPFWTRIFKNWKFKKTE